MREGLPMLEGTIRTHASACAIVEEAHLARPGRPIPGLPSSRLRRWGATAALLSPSLTSLATASRRGRLPRTWALRLGLRGGGSRLSLGLLPGCDLERILLILLLHL